MTFGYYKNCLYTHRYNFSSEKKKKNKWVKSPRYIVSHPETGSDSPIGSNRESGGGGDNSLLGIGHPLWDNPFRCRVDTGERGSDEAGIVKKVDMWPS